jgi:uncharacterized protein YigA (DUF484 family)
MTNPQLKSDAKAAKGAAAAESAIATHLAEHPDFFDRHPAVLAQLRLPHLRGDGSTVSLVERQVDVLRERLREHDLQLKTLIENGRANDALAQKTQRLALGLVAATSAVERLRCIESSLRSDFGAHELVLLLTRPAAGLEAVEARCLRILATDDPGLRSFDTLLASGRPRCGRVRDSQRSFLFPAADTLVGSVALVPLGPAGATGLMAIASPDADHFNPTMSTDFLARIGELIAVSLDATPELPA